MKDKNNHINYIEFYCNDISLTKNFYSMCFGWTFTDYGINYIAFKGAGLEGGFEKIKDTINNGVLVVLYNENLEACLQKVKTNGGVITKEIFSFPGGKRFQFLDPSGNELAVWKVVEE